ncbi:MAG: S8 family serine peptidase [Bacteroidia bacterium]|nr:S8 family serine peptidase [Bacteroidia bacterium]
MKSIFGLLVFSMITVASFAQQIHPDYLDGQLYWRVKANEQAVLMDSVLAVYQIQAVEAPFQKLSFAGLKGREELDILGRTYRIRFSNYAKINGLASYLTSLSKTDLVEKVPLVKTFYTPNDPQFASQYNLATINAPAAWNLSLGNPNVRVAVVDDAVRTSHQDLAPSIWVNPGEIPGNGLDDDFNGYIDDVSGYDVADNDNDPMPPLAFATSSVYTHGTHCAGIVAAATDNATGIASIGFGLKIIPVKCNNDATPGPSLPAAWDGVTYAISVLPEVISLSWGGPAYSATNQTLINLAYANDIIVVAAAGNSNVNTPMYPASYNHVISVAATDQTDTRASFSNYGPTVDVSAPGVGILSTLAGNNSDYGLLSGTSMACPLVAGLCGLMKSYNPLKTVDQIDSCLRATADNIDLQNPGFIGQLGAGRVNALNALLCVSGTPVANFVPDTDQPCPGQNVQFTDQSYGSPTTWAWQFPGGVPATSSLQNPLVNYPVAGVYPCTLIVSNVAGIDTMIYHDITVAIPSANLSGGGLINPGSPAFLTVNFTGSPPYSIIYTDGVTNFPLSGIMSSPFTFPVNPLVTTNYTLVSMASSQCAGTVSGSALVDISTGCAAQVSFQDILGGSSMDNPNSVRQTPDCGYLVAGSSFSFGTGLYDAVLAKYDLNGNFLWYKTYGEALDNTIFYDAIPVSNGYVAVGGRSANNQSRMYVVKTDLNGVLLWHRTIQYVSGGGTIGAFAWEAVEMANGDIALAGGGAHANFNDNGRLMMRLNSITGATIWETNFQVNDFEYEYGITRTAGQGLIGSGFSRSVGVTSGLYDMSLIERTGAGALVWSKNYGGPQNEYAYDHVRLPDQGFIVVGKTEGFSASVSDIMAIRTDSAGNLIWAKTYSRPAADVAWKIVPGCNGKYFIGGSSRSPGNGNDGLLFQIDIMGNVLWAETVGGILDDGDQIGLGPTGDCGCIYAMSTLSYGVGENDMLILKTDSLGNAGCHTDPVVLTVTNITPNVINASPTYSGFASTSPVFTTIEQSHIPSRPDDICDACGFPVADFDYVTNVLSLTAIDGSVNGVSWKWDFGDGSPTDTLRNAVHVFPGPGVYTVTLIVTSSCGSDTTAKTVTITGLNECLHVYQPGPVKGIDAFVFSRDDTRNTNYGSHPYHMVMTWTFSGNLGTSRAHQYFDLSKICNSATLLDGRYSVFYNTVLGQPHSGANTGTMSRCTTPWDEYAITWLNQPTTTPTNAAAVPLLTGSVNLVNLNVTPLFQDLISGPNYGFQWRHNVEGTYRRTIMLSSDWPIQEERPRLELRFDPIFAYATVQPGGSHQVTICPGDSVQLNLAGYLNSGTTSGPSVATKYLWVPSTGLSCDTCPNPKASPDSTLTYKAVAYNCPSCADIDTIRVTVSQVWVEAPNQILCTGDSVQMNAFHPIPGTHFTWTPPGTIFPTNVQNPNAFPTVPTWYYVTAVDTVNNCVTSDSALVLTGAASPLPTLINDTTVSCDQGTIIFPLNPDFIPIGSDYYEWNLPANITPDPNSPSSDAIINTNVSPVSYKFILKVTNEFGCETVDSVTVNVPSCLPVTLFSFTGQKVEGGNFLEWATEPGVEAGLFELERSADGSTFELLNTQNPHANQAQFQTYSFMDPNPFPGDNFYRLKITDLNGASQYSEIILLSQDLEMRVSLYPNPGKDRIWLKAERELEDARVRIMSLSGQVVLERNNLNGRQVALNCSPLARGAYFLELAEKGHVYRFKLVLQ